MSFTSSLDESIVRFPRVFGVLGSLFGCYVLYKSFVSLRNPSNEMGLAALHQTASVAGMIYGVLMIRWGIHRFRLQRSGIWDSGKRDD